MTYLIKNPTKDQISCFVHPPVKAVILLPSTFEGHSFFLQLRDFSTSLSDWDKRSMER
jgi:hypothetical protein